MSIPVNKMLQTTRPLKRGDEVECADRLLDIFRTRADCIVAVNDALWLYNKQTGLWAAVSRDTLIGEAQQLAGLLVGKRKMKHHLRLSHSQCCGIVACVLTNLNIAQPGFFDGARIGFAFKDKFITCVDGELVAEDHNPDNRVRHGTDLYWNPTAKYNAWRSFLNGVFKPDNDAEQKRAFLQEFVGAALLGIATQFRKCILLEGGGSNGKSVLIEVVRSLFPPSALASIPPNRWRHEYYAADLDGILLNTIGETPRRAVLASEEFKNVLGGDPLTGRHPRGRPFEFHPRAAHILATNGLPEVNDQSEGFWDRFMVLEFNRRFLPTDPDYVVRGELDQRLAEDRCGIIVWALKGAARLLVNRGFTLPASSGAALNVWQDTTDTVKAWITQNCEVQSFAGDHFGEKKATNASVLYRNYVGYCRKNSQKIESVQAFGNRLRALRVPRKRAASGILYGVKLKAGKINFKLH